MKQISINLFKFSELSEASKEKAVNKFCEQSDIHMHNDGYENSLKAFCELFDAKHNYSIGLCSHSHVDICSNLDDDILQLSGPRLISWVVNNTKLLDKKRKSFTLNDLVKVSKVLHESDYMYKDCMLTGYAYDIYLAETFVTSMLKGLSLDSCLDEAASAFCSMWVEDLEYLSSEKYALECLENDDDEEKYLECGSLQ